MSKVKIYYFNKYDMTTDKNVRSIRPATREAVKVSGGTVIEESEQEVESSCLDGNGFLSEKSVP